MLALAENCRIFARDRRGCICPSRMSIRLQTWPSEFSFQSRCVPMHRATRLARHRQRMRDVLHAQMSAFGPKQTWACELHMSAIGGKADRTRPRASSEFHSHPREIFVGFLNSNCQPALSCDFAESDRPTAALSSLCNPHFSCAQPAYSIAIVNVCRARSALRAVPFQLDLPLGGVRSALDI